MAYGEDFPDALAAAPLASYYGAPILLTEKDRLSSNVKAELERLKVKNVIVIGGSGVVSDSVKTSIENINYDGQMAPIAVERIYGQDRYKTSLEIAKRLPQSNTIAVLSGDNFPDALSMAPIAAEKKMPIILVSKSQIDPAIKTYLSEDNVTKTYLIGGPGVISDTVMNQFGTPERIYGQDRYETNIKIIQKFQGSLDLTKTFVAYGENFPDGLAGSVLAAKSNSAIILTNGVPYNSTRDYIKNNISSISKLNILGGSGVIPLDTVQNLFVDRKLGNSSGNLNNSGYIAERNGWVYNAYTNSDYLHKIKTDGSQNTRLLLKQTMSINVSDKYIFYIDLWDNHKIYRMNLDGSNKICINSKDQSDGFVLYDGYIYYKNVSDSRKIYRMDINGSGRTKLVDDTECNYINVTDNNIYYVQGIQRGSIYRINKDGSGRTLIKNGDFSEPVVLGNSIYFIDYSNAGFTPQNLAKINLDGSGYKRLNDDRCYSFTILGDTIYYENSSDGDKIYSIKLDGTFRNRVNNTASYNLSSAGDSIYYTDSLDLPRPPYSIKVTDIPEKAPSNIDPLGNNPGNILYGGFAAENNGYIYAPSPSKQFTRYNADGSNPTALDTGWGSNLNVEGDWVYYTIEFANGPGEENYYHIEKSKIDGSQNSIILANVRAKNMIVVGDWIYYTIDSSTVSQSSIEKVRIDGTGRTLITCGSSSYYNSLNVAGDWLYYIDQSDSTIYKIKTDGTQKTKVIDTTDSNLVITQDGKYAYFHSNSVQKWIRLNLQDSSVLNLPDNVGYNLIISGDKIYYDGSNLEKIYSSNLDGTSESYITDLGIFNTFNVAGNFLYYWNYTTNSYTSIKIK